nr:neutral/alkaline non-lysosomal ceramidase N-terminal domain-containing protein [Porticoccaceae bacterium]
QTTCPSAYGYSFAGGSTEDGGGHFLFEEGMTEQSLFLDLLIGWLTGAPKWTQAVKTCQAPKAILFETGSGNPPLQSQIRSVTIARLGQLVILAMPTEITTMAGRRLRAAVMKELGDWANHSVLAGYSNGYAGYVTTPEEYLLQQYEGGHTLHGRWTLPAYQQIASHLASTLNAGTAIESNTIYDDWRGKSFQTTLHSGAMNTPPKGAHYGDPLPSGKTKYRKGETVVAEFWSNNPSANYVTGSNYMQVDSKTSAGWQTVATDSDWNTTVRWRNKGESFIAKLSWQTPANTKVGEYRITHLGHDQQGAVFSGVSRKIQIH